MKHVSIHLSHLFGPQPQFLIRKMGQYFIGCCEDQMSVIVRKGLCKMCIVIIINNVTNAVILIRFHPN